MYFGIRYAVNHTDRDDDLAGLLITGTGDVFAPGGDLSRSNEDGWSDLPNLLGMDNTPFDALRQSQKPVVSAVNGLCQGGWAHHRDVVGCKRGERARNLSCTRIVPGHC
jgi:enoyl-CoA hydratase